jgi:hypothetical protein
VTRCMRYIHGVANSLANASTVDQCSQPYARVDYAVSSCPETAMSNSLPKLSWLPDFDGRKRLYRPLNKNKQEIRVVEISPDMNRSAPLSCVLRTIPYKVKLPSNTTRSRVTGGQPWTWKL